MSQKGTDFSCLYAVSIIDAYIALGMVSMSCTRALSGRKESGAHCLHASKLILCTRTMNIVHDVPSWLEHDLSMLNPPRVHAIATIAALYF